MLENKIELSGKHGFDIFLDIITDFDLLFIKQDYYNTSDYWYFFTTERITKKQEILDSLKRKKSLKTAYMTLVTLKDKRLSFFFAVKDYSVFYGFYDETNRYIYKVGKFKTTNEDFKKLYSKKCRALIETINYGCNVFISEGTLVKQSIQVPQPIPTTQTIIQDNRTFEGWKYEKS